MANETPAPAPAPAPARLWAEAVEEEHEHDEDCDCPCETCGDPADTKYYDDCFGEYRPLCDHCNEEEEEEEESDDEEDEDEWEHTRAALLKQGFEMVRMADGNWVMKKV